MAALLQLMLVGMWGFTLIFHMRRLMRLARVETLRRWDGGQFRTGLNRIWWWLGQDAFWRGVQIDGMRCVEITLMSFLLVWGLGS